MNMKKKNGLLLSVLSLILFFSTVPLASYLYGYGGHNMKFSLIIILYTLATFVCMRISKSKLDRIIGIAILVVPPVLIMGFIYLRSIIQGVFQETSISWLSSCAYLFGIGLGYLVYISNRVFQIFTSLIIVVFSIWMFFIGYNYYFHYLNYSSFTGITLKHSPDYKFTDKYSNIFQNSDFKDRTVIFDFWFTRCGICIKDMPKFEKYFQKYGRDGKFYFYSINCPISSDTLGYAEYIVRDYGFSFPLLYTDNETIKLFHIKYYPTYIVIKNGNVIFQGNMDNLETFLERKTLHI